MRIPLFLIAVLGLLVSGYLFVTYTSGGPIECGVGHGCDTVRASQYASFLGVPTPAYGLLFYLLLAVSALMATPVNRSWIRWPLSLLTAAGLVVSAGLTYIEAFVIDAWCMWCVVSALLALVAFLLVWFKPWK
ncbi:hypothetical protein CL628_01570 [bacterium]|nr:hypothetical protein [bacterium]